MKETDTNLSIDSIWFTTPEFSVKTNNSLIIKGSEVTASTGEIRHNHELYIDEYGEVVSGKMGYHKDFENAIEFSIMMPGKKSFLGIKVHRPATFLGLSQLETITSFHLDSLIRELELYMAGHGIIFDEQSLFVTLIDLNRTFELNYPLRFYEPILEHLKFSRHNTFKYEGSIYYGKGKRKRKVYEKRKQMVDAGHPVDADIPENLTRIELTYSSRKVIEGAFGFWRPRDFAVHWGTVQRVAKNDLEQIFKDHPYKADEIKNPKSATDQMAALTESLRQGPSLRGLETKVLLQFAAGQLWKYGYTPELYRELVAKYRPGDTASSKKRIFRELQKAYILACGSVEDVPIAQLYREFRAKALGDAD